MRSLRTTLSLMVLLAASGCVINNNKDGDAPADDTDDTTGNGGNNTDTWHARGGGKAYLLDGELDHSKFTLELTRVTEPAEGQHYYGWLMGGSEGVISLGEITVDGEQVIFEHELGFNGFTDGYTIFEAYMAESQPSAPGEGEIVWRGELGQDAISALTELLIESPDYPNHEGSLRAIETTVEVIRDFSVADIDTTEDVLALQVKGEAVANAIKREELDRNNDGTVQQIQEVTLGLLGTEGHVGLILDDLRDAFNAFGGQQADSDVRDALDDAYDCVENIEDHALDAYSYSGTVTVCGAATSCRNFLYSAHDSLQLVLDGEDLNADGVISPDEGTVECAIEHISRLLAFDVAVP